MAELQAKEHEAVKREREALAALQSKLSTIEDPDERVALLEEFVQRLDQN